MGAKIALAQTDKQTDYNNTHSQTQTHTDRLYLLSTTTTNTQTKTLSLHSPTDRQTYRQTKENKDALLFPFTLNHRCTQR